MKKANRGAQARTDPARIAAHKQKMMGKFFRNLEPGRVGFAPNKKVK